MNHCYTHTHTEVYMYIYMYIHICIYVPLRSKRGNGPIDTKIFATAVFWAVVIAKV